MIKITIGDFTFNESQDDYHDEPFYWMERQDGEGMGISKELVHEALDKFFREHH